MSCWAGTPLARMTKVIKATFKLTDPNMLGPKGIQKYYYLYTKQSAFRPFNAQQRISLLWGFR